MVNATTCSMLDSTSTSYDDDMDNGVSKSIVLGLTIKHLTE